MNPYVSLALLICVIIGLIFSIVFKLMRLRIVNQMFELITCGLFIAYASQYAYLFSYLDEIAINQIVLLLLFISSLILGIYKIITVIIQR